MFKSYINISLTPEAREPEKRNHTLHHTLLPQQSHRILLPITLQNAHQQV